MKEAVPETLPLIPQLIVGAHYDYTGLDSKRHMCEAHVNAHVVLDSTFSKQMYLVLASHDIITWAQRLQLY